MPTTSERVTAQRSAKLTKIRKSGLEALKGTHLCFSYLHVMVHLELEAYYAERLVEGSVTE
jgi:hypothetical protein